MDVRGEGRTRALLAAALMGQAAASNGHPILNIGVNEMSSQELSKSDENLRPNFPTIQCPDCGVRWLAPGVRHGEVYACKECGLTFVVNKSATERTGGLRREDVR